MTSQINKNYLFRTLNLIFKLVLLLIIESYIICLIKYEMKLIIDDCFMNIEINSEVKYSVEYCNFLIWRITYFDNFVGNYGDKIKFKLKDDGDPIGYCYIKGYIKINEYKIDASYYNLWECTNCKYVLYPGNVMVKNLERLNCGGNFGLQIVYDYNFSVPKRFEELKKYGVLDTSSYFYKINSHTVYIKKMKIFI